MREDRDQRVNANTCRDENEAVYTSRIERGRWPCEAAADSDYKLLAEYLLLRLRQPLRRWVGAFLDLPDISQWHLGLAGSRLTASSRNAGECLDGLASLGVEVIVKPPAFSRPGMKVSTQFPGLNFTGNLSATDMQVRKMAADLDHMLGVGGSESQCADGVVDLPYMGKHHGLEPVLSGFEGRPLLMREGRSYGGHPAILRYDLGSQ